MKTTTPSSIVSPSSVNEDIVIHTFTNGDNHWSNVIRHVKIIKLVVTSLEQRSVLDSDFGELRAYFDTDDWDVQEIGYIYTDKGWIANFRSALRSLDFSEKAVADISYSERGMQGRDYVSLDIGKDFLVECDAMVRFTGKKKNLTDFLMIEED